MEMQSAKDTSTPFYWGVWTMLRRGVIDNCTQLCARLGACWLRETRGCVGGRHAQQESGSMRGRRASTIQRSYCCMGAVGCMRCSGAFCCPRWYPPHLVPIWYCCSTVQVPHTEELPRPQVHGAPRRRPLHLRPAHVQHLHRQRHAEPAALRLFFLLTYLLNLLTWLLRGPHAVQALSAGSQPGALMLSGAAGLPHA